MPPRAEVSPDTMTTSADAPLSDTPTTRRPPAALVLLALAALSFVADFWHVRQFRMLGDDWVYLGRLVNYGDAEAWRQIIDTFLHSWEARPLVGLEHALLWSGFKIAGLSGSYLVQWVLLSVSAFVLYRLMRRKTPEGIALLTALIFILYPAYNTRAWAASTVNALGLLFVLLALEQFASGRRVWFAVLATASLLTYELAFFQVVLAPFFAPGATKRNMREAYLIAALILAGYGLWRGLILPTYQPDARADLVRERGIVPTPRGYLSKLASAPRVILLRDQGDALERVIQRTGRRGMLLILLGAMAAPWALSRRFFRALSEALGWGYSRALVIGRRRTPPHRYAALVHEDTSALTACAGIGLLSIFAGTVLNFWAPAAIDFTFASRFNCYSSVGAAIFMAAVLGAAGRLSRQSWRRTLIVPVITLYLCVLFLFRWSIQADYVDSAAKQARILDAISRQAQSVGPADALLLEGLNLSPPFPPAIAGATWELHALASSVLGREVKCFAPHHILSADASSVWFGDEEINSRVTYRQYARERLVHIDLTPIYSTLYPPSPDQR